MASKPRHPIWLEVIEEMKNSVPWWCVTKHFKIMASTGPMMLDRVVKRGKYQYTALPTKYVMPCSICDINCKASGAYVKPLKGGSWNSIDSQMLNFFMCSWKKIAWVFLIVVIVTIIGVMIWKRSQASV